MVGHEGNISILIRWIHMGDADRDSTVIKVIIDVVDVLYSCKNMWYEVLGRTGEWNLE